MGEKQFSVLVVAIVALALIGLFLFQFTDLFEEKQGPEKTIKKQLKKAETQLGEFVSEKIVFPSEWVALANGFESSDRSIVFQCNHAELCCAKGQKCNKPIEWNNTGKQRYVSTKKKKKITLSTRCRYKNLYICKIYLGKKPAQIKINEIEAKPLELDLTKEESVQVEFEVENSGEKDMILVETTANLYIIGGLDQKKERKLKKTVKEGFPLKKNEKYLGGIEIKVGEKGRYELEILFKETTDETNYKKKLFKINAGGEVKKECSLGKMEIKELEECVYILPCECSSVSECKQKWKKRLGLKEGKLELLSMDEERERIELEYRTEYGIADWCDPTRMECEKRCPFKNS